jgi:putative glutathione S-transferase
VPVLWDKKERTIVNNESAEILRMFNSAFQEVATKPEVDLYPQELRGEIDSVRTRAPRRRRRACPRPVPRTIPGR